jgi:penicillin-binding protein 1C
VVETKARSGQPPQIVTPASGQAYSVGEGQSIPLRALIDADAARVYWFVDKAFLGSATCRETLAWSAPPGTYRLTALDDHGRAGISKVVIEPRPLN